jgi:DNA-binding NarL/FixJ family response regulator
VKILIVEDDPQLQRTFARFLKRHFDTTDITVVDNASDAIFLASTHDYGLIMSDYNLVAGSENGGAVLAWIRENRPEFVKKFVFLSSDEATKTLHDRVLMKPCTTDDLREVLRGF